MMNPIALVTMAMTDYFSGDVRRINHFMKVYAFAKTIGELEGLTPRDQLTLEVAALTHDIGIKESERKYGSSSGHYQQLEGPPEARALLNALQIPADVTERVCWLIAHHHTYANIHNADHQILVEADFLVNICEAAMNQTQIRAIERKVFRTAAGRRLLLNLYPASAEEQ